MNRLVMRAMCGVAAFTVATPADAGSFGAAQEVTQLLNNVELASIAGTELEILAANAEQIANQVIQIENQVRDFQNQTLNTLPIDVQRWGEVVGTIKRLRRAMRDAGAIAAQAKGLDVRMRAQFRRADLYGKSALSAFDYAESYDDWISLTQNAADSALSIASATFEDVDDEAELLAQLETASRSAIGRQQALEIGNMVAGSVARQMGQLRALTAQHAEQVAVFNAKNGFDRDQYVLSLQQAKKRIETAPQPESIDWRERAADGEVVQ